MKNRRNYMLFHSTIDAKALETGIQKDWDTEKSLPFLPDSSFGSPLESQRPSLA